MWRKARRIFFNISVAARTISAEEIARGAAATMISRARCEIIVFIGPRLDWGEILRARLYIVYMGYAAFRGFAKACEVYWLQVLYRREELCVRYLQSFIGLIYTRYRLKSCSF